MILLACQPKPGQRFTTDFLDNTHACLQASIETGLPTEPPEENCGFGSTRDWLGYHAGREEPNGRTARGWHVTGCFCVTAPTRAIPSILALVELLGLVPFYSRPPGRDSHGVRRVARQSDMDAAVLLVWPATDAGVAATPEACVAVLRAVDGCACRAGCRGCRSLTVGRSLRAVLRSVAMSFDSTRARFPLPMSLSRRLV
jgi:hypothetical protein